MAILPEVELRFEGHSFLKIRDGKIEVDGLDYERDLAKVSRLIAALSDVLYSAASCAEAKPAAPKPVSTDNVFYLGARKAALS